MTDAQAFTQANRAYFDKMAATYDTKPWQQKMSAQILPFLRENSDIVLPKTASLTANDTKNGFKLLDYACGTGLITKALQPYLTTALGIDISPSMVTRYNTLFPSTFAQAVEADLLSAPPRLPSSSDANSPSTVPTDFDVAAVGLGFHHFHSPANALVALAQRVRTGGTVVIVDFAPFPAAGGHGHGHGHHHHHEHGKAEKNEDEAKGKDEEKTEEEEGKIADENNNAFPIQTTQTIKTHGFNAQDMANLFRSAGLEVAGYRSLPEEIEMFVGPAEKRVTRTVFVAVGIKKV